MSRPGSGGRQLAAAKSPAVAGRRTRTRRSGEHMDLTPYRRPRPPACWLAFMPSPSRGPGVEERGVLRGDVGPEHRVQVHRRRVFAGWDLAAECLGHSPDVVRTGAAADAHVVHAEVTR